ncbi:MAG: patatin-like phospholipase family protein [Lachnospiraceae bacterium]|nr:patatin-like phospholipase family protein [Lachnospiraceae bacterium]
MKRAVVLCGGGTKGSYELGVWQALRELDIDYQIVTGTSIGAINGAMMVIGDYENAKTLWETIEMERIMGDGMYLTNTVEGMYNQRDTLKPFLKKYVHNRGIDVSPFKTFITELIDEERIRKSGIDFGLVTVRVSPLKPLELRIKHIPEGMLKDYIMCSSAIFPLFPMHKIGNKTYVDGCYYDNLPIDLALKMGADEVIAVDLNPSPSHPEYLNKPFVHYIYPRKSLGAIINFEREVLNTNSFLGYQDAMKSFGAMKGFVYTFEKESLKKYEKQIRRYLSKILRLDSEQKETLGMFVKPSKLQRVCDSIEEQTRGAKLTKEDYFIRGAEICGEFLGISSEKIYTMEEFIELIGQKKSFLPQSGTGRELAAELFVKICI